MGGKPRPAPARARATVRVASNGGPLFVDAPTPFLDSLESGARVAVRGRLGAAEFVSALVLLGGRRRLVVNRELAERAGVYDGARTTLELERIPEPTDAGKEPS